MTTTITSISDYMKERAGSTYCPPLQAVPFTPTAEQKRNCTGNREMMLALTQSFPALVGYPHEKWDPDEFVAWAKHECHSSTEWHAALFIAAVWNVHMAREMSAPPRMKDPGKGRGFDAIEALVVWDSGNRAAFAAWARDPWWA